MFNIQGSEIIIILLLALVVLGPEKLPEAMRKLGKTVAELKKMSSGFQEEFKSVLDEPMREARETAELLRKSVDFTDGDLKSLGKPEKAKSGSMADATVSPAAESPSDPAPPDADSVPGRTAGDEHDGATDAEAEAQAAASEHVDDGDAARDRPPGPAFHSASPRAMNADPVKVSAPFASWPTAGTDAGTDADAEITVEQTTAPGADASESTLSPPASNAAPVLSPPPAPTVASDLPAPTGAALPDPTESS